MSRRRKQPVFLGESRLREPGPAGGGRLVERDGERFYRIADYHAMPPFFMSVVSGYDHWLFVSSTGGLTCGRRAPENALFPYCTDDKVHDASETTGPWTAMLAQRAGETRLWRPFDGGPSVYDLERNLYKNVPGNKLVFEEINRDLGLVFAYGWTTGDRFGFVRSCRLSNVGDDEVRVRLLDGLRNLLPPGVDRGAQSELSTLVDAYKRAEAVAGASAGVYSLSSLLTDRAEPNEALEATVVWSTGLDGARLLLCEDQLPAFCAGAEVDGEALKQGKRGAFFIHSTLALSPQAARSWYVVADVEQGPAQTVDLLHAVRRGVAPAALEEDVAAGTARLERLAGRADAFQRSSDELVAGRHFSNALFNIMRGGVFPHDYRFPRADFLDFVAAWNRPLHGRLGTVLAGAAEPMTLHSALDLCDEVGDADLTRLVYEYLPLTFSRRHGDPSRPWNHFSIELDGLSYQGNWRDIFQNWEALALSFPEYVESFIAKFVNASTADGHNPYRISRDGFDWEVPEPEVPWSNIGYWGDHQIVYLLRLLERSRDYHPGRLGESLSREIFVYADVPYRIRPYPELVRDPRNTVDYDDARAAEVAARVAEIGTDGKLLTLEDGSVYRVNLLEKLLVPALAKLCSLVPGGGIWMNTQRPEWNDANNALVGHGLSMVTLCHLRRYLHLLRELLDESPPESFDVSQEVARLLEDAGAVLDDHEGLLEGVVGAAQRKSFMDGMGAAGDRYRARVYGGFSGGKVALAGSEIRAFIGKALDLVDHSIAHGRRTDGLFHAYSLIRFGSDAYDVEPLEEMLEGQVAVLASGSLDAEAALKLLLALRASRLYREDQNSYLLYPDRQLPSFLDKNVIPPELVKGNDWPGYIERDCNGRLHFNGAFRNAAVLRAALDDDPAVDAEGAEELCRVYETVFAHRRFTGRSGTMVKYEGLGSIYWHMVSKLLLATAETIVAAADEGADPGVVERLGVCFREIRDGLGLHKSPATYGAFPVDPYSHTPAFAGVQQPGMTGQVKEDVITRFLQLGVRVARGEVAFRPVLLERDELLDEPACWRYSVGGETCTIELPAGSLAFTLCGVPVVYRRAEAARLQVFGEDGTPTKIEGNRLGPELSRSLFRREGRIAKLVVDVPEAALR